MCAFLQIYQLVLPLDIEHLIPDDDSVRLLSQFYRKDVFRRFISDLLPGGARKRTDTASTAQDLGLWLHESSLFQSGDCCGLSPGY